MKRLEKMAITDVKNALREKVIALTPVAARSCGTCTLCCKVMAVQSLEKPAGKWCEHASKSAGCRIYATRPHACQEFKCLWLTGNLPEAMRPDKIHGVVIPTAIATDLVVMEDPGWPRAASDALRHVIDLFVASGKHYVVVACGDDRRLIAAPELAARMELRAIAATGDVLPKLGGFEIVTYDNVKEKEDAHDSSQRPGAVR